MRLGIAIDVPSIVEKLYEPDVRGIELATDVQSVVVAALLYLMALEGRSNKDRNHQLVLCARNLRQRKHRAGARSLATRSDENDHRESAEERLHLAS